MTDRPSAPQPETWIVEYGAVSLPLGHPSRITVVEAHRSEELAAASLAKAREDFDAHMWKALDQAALDAAVAAARAEERAEVLRELREWEAEYMHQARGGDNSGRSDARADAAREIHDHLSSSWDTRELVAATPQEPT